MTVLYSINNYISIKRLNGRIINLNNVDTQITFQWEKYKNEKDLTNICGEYKIRG